MDADLPFVGTEAVAAGVVNRYQLATRYDAIFRNVYVPRGHQLTPIDKARAAWLFSGRRGTVAGLSAAALHGTRWIDPRLPAELNQRSRYPSPGILLHSDTLLDCEAETVAGVAVTTPARTAFDLGRRDPLTTAVIRVDALMQATKLDPIDVAAVAERHRGARGIVNLRRVIELADAGAESPQETRTRLILTDAGMRPQTQLEVYDEHGIFVGRLDMGWRRWKVAVEYDGAQHWTDPAQRTRDLERWAAFEDLAWRIVHVGNDMLRYQPARIVARSIAALRAAGCPT